MWRYAVVISMKKVLLALLLLLALICLGDNSGFTNVYAQSTQPESLTVNEIYQPGPGLPVGKIQSVWGYVAIMHVDVPDAYLARVGLPLFNGDTIVTPESGGFGCKLNDGSVMKLASNSKLQLIHSTHDAGRKSSISSLSLGFGKAYFKIAKLDDFEPREFRVETDTIVTGGRQANFAILMSAESTEIVALKDTLLEVMHMADPERKIFLSEFQRLVIEDGTLPSTVEIIPEEKVAQLVSKFEHFSESSISDISRSKFLDTETGEEDLQSVDVQVEEIQEEESKDDSLTAE
jgi:hypothetical protein